MQHSFFSGLLTSPQTHSRLSPFVGGAALATGAAGNVDWACTSVGVATATANGYGAATAGTVVQRYAPAPSLLCHMEL